MANERLESTLEILEIGSGSRSVVYRAAEHFEAPNWSRDGTTLYFNAAGRIYTIPVTGGQPAAVDTGFAAACNNDHGLSPDGSLLAISDQSRPGGSRIYVLPASGGVPRLITERAPSYWHGWSPDGKTLAYCAQRDGTYGIFVTPVRGGTEQRLTTAAEVAGKPGLDDGPDYSVDGNYIYFNSDRTGRMKIWRIAAGGGGAEQISPDDEHNDWFAHPSPDGRWIVFLSYGPEVKGHPPNKDVSLRIIPTPEAAGGAERGTPRVIGELFGGQGTINVPSWSPDSTRFAFVSYRLLS